jgi:4-alpha-glucanotransferase
MDIKLYHDSHKSIFRSLFGAVPTGARLTLRLSALGITDEQVYLRLWPVDDGDKLLPMTRVPGTDLFEANFNISETSGLIWYFFMVKGKNFKLYYGNNKSERGGEGQQYDHEPPSYQITVYDKNAVTPDWFKHAVVYQIFPDRFARGGTRTDDLAGKRNAVLHSCWDDKPYYCKDAQGGIVQYDFFGGNIAGIQEKLSYLSNLGINAIYLNPIFVSASNHRYDTGDYKHIDPFLGTNEEFAELCKKAKALGIRIILDGVFSHTGDDSLYFNKYGTYPTLGAYQSKDSPYYSWYKFNKYPDDYESWWGVGTLPEVTETTPSYMNYIFKASDSVMKQWLSLGISGWRLDVVDELPPKFLESFWQELKKQNKDNVLIGEVWEDASNKVSYNEQRAYFSGGKLDSVMNYVMRSIMLDFMLEKADGSETMSRILQQEENYPPENFYACLNLVGSHDVERVLTVLTRRRIQQ